jgi:hypothetical protein
MNFIKSAPGPDGLPDTEPVQELDHSTGPVSQGREPAPESAVKEPIRRKFSAFTIAIFSVDGF